MDASAAQIARWSFLGRQDGAQEQPDAPTWPSRRFLDEFGVPKRGSKRDQVEHLKRDEMEACYGHDLGSIFGSFWAPQRDQHLLKQNSEVT